MEAAGCWLSLKPAPLTRAAGLLRGKVAEPPFEMVKGRASATPVSVPAGKVKLPPLAVAVAHCWTLIAAAGSTVPWTVKVKGLLSGSSLAMLTVPVKVPGVADRRRTRKTPLPPAGMDDGALMMRLKALPPTTSAVGLLMLSVAPPLLAMVNC